MREGIMIVVSQMQLTPHHRHQYLVHGGLALIKHGTLRLWAQLLKKFSLHDRTHHLNFSILRTFVYKVIPLSPRASH